MEDLLKRFEGEVIEYHGYYPKIQPPLDLEIHWAESQTSIGLGYLLPLTTWHSNARYVIEIGVFSGFTSDALMHGMAEGSYFTAADVDEWRLKNVGALQKEKYPHLKYDYIFGDSKDIDWLAEANKRGFDCIDVAHIDGDHSYEGILNDLRAVTPAIKPGGYIVIHDYAPGHEAVVRGVNEWCEEYGFNIIYFGDKEWKQDYDPHQYNSHGFCLLQKK